MSRTGRALALPAALLPLAALALPPAEPRCQRVLAALQPGQAITAADLEPAPCGSGPVAGALRHDARLRLTRARVALAPGDLVPEVGAATLARWRGGETVRVTRRAGPVQVERTAQVAVPAPRGATLLLRTADGTVLAAPNEQVREIQP